MRDKVSSQGPAGISEPNALIPSCHAPGFEARGVRGLGELIRFVIN